MFKVVNILHNCNKAGLHDNTDKQEVMSKQLLYSKHIPAFTGPTILFARYKTYTIILY